MELEFRVFLGGEYPEKILVKQEREGTLISSSHNCQQPGDTNSDHL